jgi:hypothetical protein
MQHSLLKIKAVAVFKGASPDQFPRAFEEKL